MSIPAVLFGGAFCATIIVRGLELYHVPIPSDWVLWRPILRWAKGTGHASDCSLHNGPAYRPWPCSCDGSQGKLKDRIALHFLQKAFDEGIL